MLQKDRQRLRELARRQLEYANSAENENILKKWDALANGRRETPTVRLLFSNFTHEVITPRMECESEQARRVEFKMLWDLVGRELFGDDTPVAPHMTCNGAHGQSLSAQNRSAPVQRVKMRWASISTR